MSKLLAAFRRAELDREAARRVREAVEAGEDPPPNPRARAGDPVRVRGLPAQMSGAAGAIRGTDPVRETIRRDGQRRRRAS